MLAAEDPPEAIKLTSLAKAQRYRALGPAHHVNTLNNDYFPALGFTVDGSLAPLEFLFDPFKKKIYGE